MNEATKKPSVKSIISLSDCLVEINHALNYWYPCESDGCDRAEIQARHVRLFEFRDRLESQLPMKQAREYAKITDVKIRKVVEV